MVVKNDGLIERFIQKKENLPKELLYFIAINRSLRNIYDRIHRLLLRTRQSYSTMEYQKLTVTVWVRNFLCFPILSSPLRNLSLFSHYSG